MTKWGETFIYAGRVLLALIVGLVIGSSLKNNAYFYKDPITPWLLGIFGGILCFVMLEVISKK